MPLASLPNPAQVLVTIAVECRPIIADIVSVAPEMGKFDTVEEPAFGTVTVPGWGMLALLTVAGTLTQDAAIDRIRAAHEFTRPGAARFSKFKSRQEALRAYFVDGKRVSSMIAGELVAGLGAAPTVSDKLTLLLTRSSIGFGGVSGRKTQIAAAVRERAHLAARDIRRTEARAPLQQWCAAEMARWRAAITDLPHLTAHPNPLGARIDSVARLRIRTPTEPPSAEAYAVPADRQSPEGRVVGYGELTETHRRVMLLGDPGMGKSWLLRLHAIALLTDALTELADPASVSERLTLPLLVRCDAVAMEYRRRERAGESLTLPAIMVAVLAGQHRETEPHVWDWLQDYCVRGYVVYLFDALDETPAGDMPVLGRLLHAHSGLRDAIVVTCRHAGYSAAVLPAADRVEAELLPVVPTRAYLDSWMLDADRRRDLDQRLRHPAVAAMARIPLLLAFLCHLAADPSEPLPGTRAGLYGRILRRFLRGEHRAAASVEHSRLPADPIEREHELLATLRPLAYAIATDPSGWRDRVPEAQLLQFLHDVPRPVGLSPAQTLRAIVVETGILVPDGDLRDGRHPPYVFIHRTMAEYLVAEHLTVNPVLLERTHLHLAADWREIWLLAAGIAPRMVVQRLVDASRGTDPLHTALRLAADAVAELAATQKAQITDLIGEILSTATQLLSTPEIHKQVYWLAARALGQLGEAALPALTAALREATGRHRRDAVLYALTSVGAPAVPMLTGNDFPAGHRFARSALQNIRDQAAVPALLDVLYAPIPELVQGAALALAEIGGPAVAPALLRALDAAQSRWPEDSYTAYTFARALRRTDPDWAVGEIAPRLNDPDRAVRRRAAAALENLGSAAVPLLLELTSDADNEVAADAVRGLNQFAGPEAIPALRAVLNDPNHTGIRDLVLSALEAMEPHPDSIAALTAAAADSNKKIAEAAFQALQRIVRKSLRLSRPAPFDPLVRLLDHPHEQVRRRSATLLVRSAAPIGLPPDPADDDSLTLTAARLFARACTHAGEASVIEELIDALTQPGLRRMAAVGLADIGTPAAIEGLCSATQSLDPMVRLLAVSVLSTVGFPRAVSWLALDEPEVSTAPGHIEKAVTHTFTTALADEDIRTRLAAACALAQRGSADAVPTLMAVLKATVTIAPTDPTRLVLATDMDYRHYASAGLARIRDPRTATAIFLVMADTHRIYRAPGSFAWSLKRFGDEVVLDAIERVIRGPYATSFQDQIAEMAFTYFENHTASSDVRTRAIPALHQLTRAASRRP